MPTDEDLAARAREFVIDLGARRASIELPAGCGKTEAAISLAYSALGFYDRVLVLTHTNAGVTAIRRRLARHEVTGPVTVTTIDAFMQRLVGAFRSLGSSIDVPESDDAYWPQLRAAALDITGTENVCDILANSYGFLIVDEYQDCSVEQHDFVQSLASRVPTVVLGDRLQAIFGFGGNILVPWDGVLAAFPPVEPFAIVPYRWRATNPGLGEWLLSEVRPALAADDALDISNVRFIRRSASDDAARRDAPWTYVNSNGTIVFVTAPWKVDTFAKTTRGNFPMLEDLGMRKVTEFARRLDGATDGPDVAGAVVAFVLDSTSRVGDALGGRAQALSRIRAGRSFSPRQPGARAALQRAVNVVMEQPDASGILRVLAVVSDIPESSCFARERYDDAVDVVRTVARGERSRYSEAADAVRAKKRFAARRDRRVTSHPALIKGLEFDTCVVLDAETFPSSTELYVALTRGSGTLHVLSSSNMLRPGS